MNNTVSIVVPALNEEETIGNTLSRTHKIMESMGLAYEIILVDDGSTDMTTERAHAQKVAVLNNGKNHGKGYALNRGFEHAKGDIIVTIDADGSHSPEDIRRLLGPVFNGADLVLGSRFACGHGKNSTKKLHYFGNNLINLLIQISTGKRITDSQTGFRAFKKEIIKEIRMISKGYEVETELTVKALRKDIVVQEVPVMVKRRTHGSSRLSPLHDGFKIFKTIIKSSVNC